MDDFQINGYELYFLNRRNKKRWRGSFVYQSTLKCNVVDNMTTVDSIMEITTVELLMKKLKMLSSVVSIAHQVPA